MIEGPLRLRKEFDRPWFLPYTSVFVRGNFALRGRLQWFGSRLVGREISSVPEQSKTEWDGRAAGMGRQPRKAE